MKNTISSPLRQPDSENMDDGRPPALLPDIADADHTLTDTTSRISEAKLFDASRPRRLFTRRLYKALTFSDKLPSPRSSPLALTQPWSPARTSPEHVSPPYPDPSDPLDHPQFQSTWPRCQQRTYPQRRSMQS